MSLLDSIEKMDDNSIEALAEVTDCNPMMEQGKLGCWALIEIGAQAAAVHFSIRQSEVGDGGSRGGYLVQVKSASTGGVEWIKNDILFIKAFCLSRQDNAGIYKIEISSSHRVALLQAKITFSLQQH